jgi:hypothetical protein
VVKPLGCGKKLSVKSSRLSVAKNASLAGIGTAGGKPKRALNLFDLDSSASNDDTTPSQSVISGFKTKPSSHRMHDPGSIVPHIHTKSVHG